jgi:exonuclease SbcC
VRVLELSLRNYRVFDEVDLELPARVIGIFGPNGAGKSTLMEAIQFACYGRARTAKDHIRTNGVLTDCAVRLVFEHGGQQYEVRRTIKGKNHQTDAELFVADRQLAAGITDVDAEIQHLLQMDVHVFRASVFAEQKQLDAFSEVTKAKRKEMVLRLLGIRPVDDARTAARKEARDTKQHANRLAGSLPDLAERQAELDAARAAAAEAGTRAAAAAEALTEAERRAAAAEDAFHASDEMRQRVEKLEVERRGQEEQAERLGERRDELAARIEAIRADLGELPDLEREERSLAGAPARLAEARRLAEAAEELRSLEADLALLPATDAESAVAELRAAEDEREAARRSHTKAEAARERADEELAAAEEAMARAAEADPSQPCPTCGRRLGEDFAEYVAHCDKAVADARTKVATAAKQVKVASASLRGVERRMVAATKAAEAVQEAARTRANVEQQIGKARGRFRELAEPFEGKAPDLDALGEAAGRAEELGRRLAALRTQADRLAETEADLAKVMESLQACRTRIQALDREAAGLAFDPEDHARVRKEREEAQRLLVGTRAEERETAAALAEAGQTASRLEGALEQARETTARAGELRDQARYLERVTVLLDGFRDHLVARIGPELSREAEALFGDLTNREYEDMRIDDDTLAIEIADGERYFPIERFSGSEADLANLALRVAISMHLSRMSGADVGMMVLDEVLGSLDVERKDLFVQTMGRLAGRFHQLFVITHAEQVKDQFPASIEVRRVGRRRSTAVLV